MIGSTLKGNPKIHGTSLVDPLLSTSRTCHFRKPDMGDSLAKSTQVAIVMDYGSVDLTRLPNLRTNWTS